MDMCLIDSKCLLNSLNPLKTGGQLIEVHLKDLQLLLYDGILLNMAGRDA